MEVTGKPRSGVVLQSGLVVVSLCRCKSVDYCCDSLHSWVRWPDSSLVLVFGALDLERLQKRSRLWERRVQRQGPSSRPADRMPVTYFVVFHRILC